MQALVFDGQLALRNIAPPQVQPGEALIRPHVVGICATDLELMRGYKGLLTGEPRVLGHEWVGTVTACDDPAWLGQRVVGEINVSCEQCATCGRGDVMHCPERTAMGIQGRDGALAEQFTLPIANLYRVPPSLRDDEAVFVEPLAAALEICDQLHVRPSDQVALVGDGRLGLLTAQVLRLTGCALTVVGRHPERWGLLRRHAIEAVERVPTIREQSFDIVVDCTGSPHGIETARRLVRPRGTLVLKSTFAGTSTLDFSALVVDEIRLVGSRCGPFGPALRLLQRGLIETAPLISAVYPFEDAPAAFDAARGALKVLIRITSDD